MKIGFSSLAAPEWDLTTLCTKVKAAGFDGIELRGLQGQLHLPLVPAVAADPSATRKLVQDHGLDLICLGTSCSFGTLDKEVLARQRSELTETVELAGALGCPLVRIFTGLIPARSSPEATLCRIAAELSVLVESAGRHRVTLVIENTGDFLSSRDLWFVVDAVGHPALKACWNPCNGLALKERSTNAIPRMAARLGLVHVCDAEYDAQGLLLEYRLPGQGQVGWEKTIDLLRGVVYRGYLVFEWPKLYVPALPEADTYLAEVAKFLKDRIAHRDPVLSAYKGDKQKPRYPSVGGPTPAPEKAAH